MALKLTLLLEHFGRHADGSATPASVWFVCLFWGEGRSEVADCAGVRGKERGQPGHTCPVYPHPPGEGGAGRDALETTQPEGGHNSPAQEHGQGSPRKRDHQRRWADRSELVELDVKPPLWNRRAAMRGARQRARRASAAATAATVGVLTGRTSALPAPHVLAGMTYLHHKQPQANLTCTMRR